MESHKEKKGIGSIPIIEPFLERNGETFGARVTQFLPGPPCEIPKQRVRMYKGYKNLAQMLVTIGMDIEELLGIEPPKPELVDDAADLH